MGMITATRRGARSGLRRGFTLVEILAVLVILGVASAMIIPQIGSRDDLKTASMARVVMADLLYAQNRAVSLQQVHYVRFDTVAGRYEVLESMSPETLITHPVNKTAFTVLLAPDRTDDLEGVALGDVDFGDQPILAFDELGTPYAYDESTGTRTPLLAAGTVALTCGEHTLTITVEPYSGEVKVN